jgi:hypothetical protein
MGCPNPSKSAGNVSHVIFRKKGKSNHVSSLQTLSSTSKFVSVTDFKLSIKRATTGITSINRQYAETVEDLTRNDEDNMGD